MKIFVVLPEFGGGGAERAHLYLMNEWVKNDNQVYLILINKKGNLLKFLDERISIIDLNSKRMIKTIIPIYNLIKIHKPKIILTAMWPLTSIVTLSWLLSFRIGKLFLGDHNPLIKSWTKDLNINWLYFCFIYNITYIFCTKIISVSDKVKEQSQQILFLRKNNIKVIYNPVRCADKYNLNIPLIRKKLFGDFKFCLISVGSLKKSRDLTTLISSFSLIKNYKQTKLIILGEGPEREFLHNYIKEKKLENNIQINGYVEDPYPYYLCSDIYIHSSIYDAMPLVLIEALVCGSNIISTDCESGPREILDNGKYGSLIPISNPSIMAKEIDLKLTQIKNTNKINERSKIFTIKKISQQYLNLFISS